MNTPWIARTVTPVLLPHGACPPGCPYCPPQPAAVRWPGPELVDDAAALGGPDRELGLFGADLWALPRGPRTALLDAAERAVRRRQVRGLRVTLSPESVLRSPLAELRARGVRTVELPVLTTEPLPLRLLGVCRRPAAGLDAIGRLRRARIRVIAHLAPGLPGDSHHGALRAADTILRARPDAVRILPALSLDGTRLAAMHRAGAWDPMSLEEGVHTCRCVLQRVRAAGVEVVRVGLQPAADLPGRPAVLGGPFAPDLRLRVESELMARTARDALTSVFVLGTRAATLAVHPAEESFLRGPESRNVIQLRRQFRLERLRVVPVPEQPRGQVRAFPGELGPEQIPPLPRRRAS